MNTIKINGRELILSPRKSGDVLQLVEATQDLEQTNTLGMITAAQVVNDSLKATYMNIMAGFDQLGWIKKFKKIKETKDYVKYKLGATTYLINELTQQELSDACQNVFDLEGIKKKEPLKDQENP